MASYSEHQGPTELNNTSHQNSFNGPEDLSEGAAGDRSQDGYESNEEDRDQYESAKEHAEAFSDLVAKLQSRYWSIQEMVCSGYKAHTRVMVKRHEYLAECLKDILEPLQTMEVHVDYLKPWDYQLWSENVKSISDLRLLVLRMTQFVSEFCSQVSSKRPDMGLIIWGGHLVEGLKDMHDEKGILRDSKDLAPAKRRAVVRRDHAYASKRQDVIAKQQADLTKLWAILNSVTLQLWRSCVKFDRRNAPISSCDCDPETRKERQIAMQQDTVDFDPERQHENEG